MLKLSKLLLGKYKEPQCNYRSSIIKKYDRSGSLTDSYFLFALLQQIKYLIECQLVSKCLLLLSPSHNLRVEIYCRKLPHKLEYKPLSEVHVTPGKRISSQKRKVLSLRNRILGRNSLHFFFPPPLPLQDANNV